MNHLHTYLYLKRNGLIRISLDSPGNVYLMKDAEYKKYLNGGEFNYVGGKVRAGKKTIKAPAQGNWHLVIDNTNSRESLNVALNITNGRQISESEICEQPEFESIGQKQTRGRSKENKQGKSDKEHEKYLRKEITKSIKKIDIKGLQFLLNQAKRLVRNQEIEKLNTEIDEYNEEVVQTNNNDIFTPSDSGDDYVIGVKKKKKSSDSGKVLIDIEQQSENTFILSLCGTRKILSRLELRAILKMCHAQINDEKFSEQLYEWLKIRRNDILFDAMIRTKNHPAWPALRRFLRSRYTAKK